MTRNQEDDMDKVSVKEIRAGICDFREMMGNKTFAPEQRRFHFSKLTGMYLSLDQDDPEYQSGAAQYIAASIEYVKRMCLMGLAAEI